MDGGGSTTMAWWNPNAMGADKSELLNFPVGTGRNLALERTVGNSLGVYYFVPIDGDVTGDGITDLVDLTMLSCFWLQSDCGEPGRCDGAN